MQTVQAFIVARAKGKVLPGTMLKLDHLRGTFSDLGSFVKISTEGDQLYIGSLPYGQLKFMSIYCSSGWGFDMRMYLFHLFPLPLQNYVNV